MVLRSFCFFFFKSYTTLVSAVSWSNGKALQEGVKYRLKTTRVMGSAWLLHLMECVLGATANQSSNQLSDVCVPCLCDSVTQYLFKFHGFSLRQCIKILFEPILAALQETLVIGGLGFFVCLMIHCVLTRSPAHCYRGRSLDMEWCHVSPTNSLRRKLKSPQLHRLL